MVRHCSVCITRSLWAPLGPLAVMAVLAPSLAAQRPFDGLHALVVEPENSSGWDPSVFGVLEERGFQVAFGRIPPDAASLAWYDLVATSIKRSLKNLEVVRLKEYVAGAGAVYGSWGGPMATPDFLHEVCKVKAARSLWLKEITPLPASSDAPAPISR